MSRFAGLVWIVLAACAQSNEVVCADGRLCAPGYRCDDENHRCISDEQVAACADLPDGADCSFGGAPGACHSGACEPLVCGDGLRTIGEACDGTDLGDADCTTAGYYEPDGLACTAFCTFDVSACKGSCGDSVINGNELCDGSPPPGACVDFGADAGPIGCASSCGLSFADCARFGWRVEVSSLALAYASAGTSENDLWVVGSTADGNATAHFDGLTWTTIPLSIPNVPIAVTTAAAGDAWLVAGPAGNVSAVVMRFAQGAWATVSGIPAADYRDVWAASANAVFVATDNGVLAFDGTTWQTLGSLTGGVAKLDGTSANDLWAAKSDGSLAHWNGTTWLPVAVPVIVSNLDALPGELWVVGGDANSPNDGAVAHWNGATWTTHLDPGVSTGNGGFPAITAAGANDAWVSAPSGTVRHFDGRVWANTTRVTVDSAYGGFTDMHRFGDVIVAHSFDGYVYRYRGQTYTGDSTGASVNLVASWSAAPNATVAIDRLNGAYHWNGSTWLKRTVDTSTALKAITGLGPTQIWAAGGARVYRFDGASWSIAGDAAGTIVGLLVFSATDLWVVSTTIERFNGSTFELQAPVGNPSGTYRAIAASGPSDVWAVFSPQNTNDTILWRWNGSQWSSTTNPRRIAALVAFAPDDAIAIDNTNRVLRWNGSTWTETVIPIVGQLQSLAASAPDDVFVASKTQIMHFDGATWSPVRAPADNQTLNRDISNLWAAPDRLDIVYSSPFAGQPFRRLLRTRPWVCRATETGCANGVDDDCDGAVDDLDSDC